MQCSQLYRALTYVIAPSFAPFIMALRRLGAGRTTMMNGSGMAMGFGWIGVVLILVLVLLAIVALIKYLRS